ncbi:cytochrome c biogenesis CcdA family protein [Magnetofaba australis]|uniref:Putative cytochrome C biogenesis protein, transmembrane region n=1 Tax=Magnetofaba australis IT-1 TaxID=1434232 RepID=A0A1Y2K314_9PROT|nr:cytochrome c biogenesis protein CcdA [Magnetofaba australis]OSM01425.1 putative cytochrome C biogenesis protein, transmembrane region [Magnetofaba australis IT-1]
MLEVSLFAAFTAGFLSFISPCVLPLVPAYLSFMSGISVDEMRAADEEGGDRDLTWHAVRHSLFFVLGFSLVFIALGATASALGQKLMEYMDILSKVGGVLIVVFGLHYMGLFRISALNLEARLQVDRKSPSVWGSLFIGLAFAFGWTPCVGPILAGILMVAGGQDTVGQGIGLLAVYSLGLGLPFILAGFAINRFMAFFARIRKHMHKVEIVAGLLLVVVGVMIFMGNLSQLSALLLEWFPGLAELG